LCIRSKHCAAHQQHHQQYFFHDLWFLVQDRLANKNCGVMLITADIHCWQHISLPDIQRSYTCDRYDGEVYDAYNDVSLVCIPVLATDAEAMVALAEPADAENVQVPVALAAVAAQVAGVGQKDLHSRLSTSLKLKTKTSSWHFFFVSDKQAVAHQLIFYGYCFITISAICDTAPAISWWLH
jgi:hypothetical protein